MDDVSPEQVGSPRSDEADEVTDILDPLPTRFGSLDVVEEGPMNFAAFAKVAGALRRPQQSPSADLQPSDGATPQAETMLLAAKHRHSPRPRKVTHSGRTSPARSTAIARRNRERRQSLPTGLGRQRDFSRSSSRETSSGIGGVSADELQERGGIAEPCFRGSFNGVSDSIRSPSSEEAIAIAAQYVSSPSIAVLAAAQRLQEQAREAAQKEAAALAASKAEAAAAAIAQQNHEAAQAAMQASVGAQQMLTHVASRSQLCLQVESGSWNHVGDMSLHAEITAPMLFSMLGSAVVSTPPPRQEPCYCLSGVAEVVAEWDPYGHIAAAVHAAQAPGDDSAEANALDDTAGEPATPHRPPTPSDGSDDSAAQDAPPPRDAFVPGHTLLVRPPLHTPNPHRYRHVQRPVGVLPTRPETRVVDSGNGSVSNGVIGSAAVVSFGDVGHGSCGGAGAGGRTATQRHAVTAVVAEPGLTGDQRQKRQCTIVVPSPPEIDSGIVAGIGDGDLYIYQGAAHSSPSGKAALGGASGSAARGHGIAGPVASVSETSNRGGRVSGGGGSGGGGDTSPLRVQDDTPNVVGEVGDTSSAHESIGETLENLEVGSTAIVAGDLQPKLPSKIEASQPLGGKAHDPKSRSTRLLNNLLFGTSTSHKTQSSRIINGRWNTAEEALMAGAASNVGGVGDDLLLSGPPKTRTCIGDDASLSPTKPWLRSMPVSSARQVATTGLNVVPSANQVGWSSGVDSSKSLMQSTTASTANLGTLHSSSMSSFASSVWSARGRPRSGHSQDTTVSPESSTSVRWQRARERKWDDSFTPSHTPRSKGVRRFDGVSIAGAGVFSDVAFTINSGVKVGPPLRTPRSEEIAAVIATPPKRPCQSKQRYLTSVVATSMSNVGAGVGGDQMLLKLSLHGYEDRKRGHKRCNVEWYGGILHSAYLRYAERIGASTTVTANGEDVVTNNVSRDLMSLAVEGSHVELREIVRQGGKSVTEDEAAVRCLKRLQSLLKPLCDEVQVSYDAVASDVLPPINAQGGQSDAGPQPEKTALERLLGVIEGVQALLEYRDATLCVIHGLLRHERALERLRRTRETGFRKDSDSVVMGFDPPELQVSRISSALIQGITVWEHRARPEVALGDWSAEKGVQNSGRPIFLWRNLDVVERLSADASSVQLPLTLPPVSSVPVTSSLREASWQGLEDLLLPYEIAAGGPEPTQSARRAALDGTRGLRSVFRSTKLPGGCRASRVGSRSAGPGGSGTKEQLSTQRALLAR
eukprot:TRINITY_DN74109_c0_g1_i1.p1 TRINITY_DN74109_c0_g1~~TRINITY_DN74109_c0_g1_i1.p1  ORF type:complete len:1373 (+),score=202.59 TRINITY_DN74109_c0_g1_i1:342-4121(+)